MSSGRLFALSGPWLLHLQNEDRSEVWPCHPGVSLSCLKNLGEVGEGRGGRRSSQKPSWGARMRERAAAEPPCPGVGQRLLTASPGTVSHALVLSSNPDPTMDSLASSLPLRGSTLVTCVSCFRSPPEPAHLLPIALAVPSAWIIPPTLCLMLLVSAAAVSRNPSSTVRPKSGPGLFHRHPPRAGAFIWTATVAASAVSARCSVNGPENPDGHRPPGCPPGLGSTLKRETGRRSAPSHRPQMMQGRWLLTGPSSRKAHLLCGGC